MYNYITIIQFSCSVHSKSASLVLPRFFGKTRDRKTRILIVLFNGIFLSVKYDWRTFSFEYRTSTRGGKTKEVKQEMSTFFLVLPLLFYHVLVLTFNMHDVILYSCPTFENPVETTTATQITV